MGFLGAGGQLSATAGNLNAAEVGVLQYSFSSELASATGITAAAGRWRSPGDARMYSGDTDIIGFFFSLVGDQENNGMRGWAFFFFLEPMEFMGLIGRSGFAWVTT